MVDMEDMEDNIKINKWLIFLRIHSLNTKHVILRILVTLQDTKMFNQHTFNTKPNIMKYQNSESI